MENRPDSPEQPTNSSYGRLFDAASPAPVATPPGQWEPPLPDEVAAMLPGYAVTGILGRGGMGAVYRGTQASLDRPVAIKLLPPELGADPEFEARFRREAKAMARLNHPNIVQIYDFGTTAGGHHYFVMEFVDGTDLHRLIHGGGLDAADALNAVSQICDALEYAHGEGFVHRDIKPANIFVNSKGILKVGDFGLAKLVDGAAAAGRPSSTELMGLTMTGMAMGTPHYVAPEQMAATGAVDHRADLYSLGVMFYEMLTGEIPRGAVKPPSQKVKALDMRLDDVVFRAMEVDPAERYQSATDLRTDVDGIRLNPAPTPAPEAVPSAVNRGERPAAASRRGKVGRNRQGPRWAGIGAVLVGLAAAAGLAIWWLGGADQRDVRVRSDATIGVGQNNGGGDLSVKPDDSGDFLDRIAGRTYYRTTNSGNSIRFLTTGVMLLRNLDGKDVRYPIELSDEGKVTWFWANGDKATASFSGDNSTFHLSDGTEFTVESGPRFATEDEELAFYVGGSEWRVEHSEKPFVIRFDERVASFSTPSGQTYGLVATNTPFRREFRWKQSDDANFLEFGKAYTTGRFFDHKVHSGPMSITRIGKPRGAEGKVGSPDLFTKIDGTRWRRAAGPKIDGGIWTFAGTEILIEREDGREVSIPFVITMDRQIIANWSDGKEMIITPSDDLTKLTVNGNDTLERIGLSNDAEIGIQPKIDGTRWRREKPAPGERYQAMAFSGDRVAFELSDGSVGSRLPFTVESPNRITWKFSDGNTGSGLFNGDFTRFNYPENTWWVREVASAPKTRTAGVLRGVWWDEKVGKAVPLPIPDGWKNRPVVSVGSHNYGEIRWWAIAEDGGVLRFDGTEPGEISALTEAVAFDWERAEAWLNKDGSLGVWEKGPIPSVPEGNDFVDVKVANSFALALRKDGTVAYWAESRSVGKDFHPPVETFRDIVAIEAAGQYGAVLDRAGKVTLWDREEGLKPVSLPPGTGAVALSSNHNSILLINSNGGIQYPDGKPRDTGGGPVSELRYGHAMGAAKGVDEKWRFWAQPGNDGEWLREFKKACDAQTLDSAIDLSITGDGTKGRAVLLWIDPVPSNDAKPGSAQIETVSLPLRPPKTAGVLRGIWWDEKVGKAVPLPIPDDWRNRPVVSVGSNNVGAGHWWAIGEDGEVLKCNGTAPHVGDVEGPIIALAFDWDSRAVWVKPDGSLGSTPEWAPVPKGDDFVDAKAGFAPLALRRDGTVVSWSGNDGARFFTPEAERLRDVVAIEATMKLTAVLKKDGSILAWDAYDGEKPIPFPPDTRIVAMSGNHNTIRFLDSKGNVFGEKGEPRGEVVGSVERLRFGHGLSAYRTAGDGRWRFAASIGDDGAFLEDFRKACEAVDLSRAIDLTITGDGPKKKSLMVWIEPMDEKRSNSTSEQKENAGTDRSVPVLMGRIHAFGFYLDGDKLVPIEPPDSQADYVACSIRSRSWNAVRATGELVVFGKEEDRPQAPITGIGPSGMIGRQNCALDRDGRLHIWGKNLQQRIGEISGLRLFDAEHRFAAGVFLDGSARIWNILPEEPAETYQPTPEEAGDVAKVVASNCGVTFLREDGTIRYVKANGVVPTHGSERFSDVDRLINGFVGLTRDGRLLTWGDSNRVMPPENAPRVIAIRGAGRFIAAKLEDGSWTGWAHEDSPDGARLVLEKLRTIRDEIDLDVYVDKEVWRVAWIQRTAPLLDPRIIGSEWSFFDGTGGSRGDTTIEVTLEKVIWKPKARPLETKLPYSVIAKNEIVIHWGEAERGARFDPDAGTVEIWRIKDPESTKVVGSLVSAPPAEIPRKAIETTRPSRSAPSDPVSLRLAEIDGRIRDQFEVIVNQPYVEAVAKLDSQIVAALKREEDAARSAGDLDAMLAWQRAGEQLKDGRGVPSEAEIAVESPPAKRPAKLLQFFATYRAELGKLGSARDERAKPLAAERDAAMAAYQQELTKAGKIEEALRVKRERGK